MKRPIAGLLVLAFLSLLIPVGAWNKTGNFVAASNAHDNLTQSTKIRVEGLLDLNAYGFHGFVSKISDDGSRG